MNPEDITSLRGHILGMLEDLGSLQAQIRYQETVPIAQVPAELVCQWFDDFYYPATPQLQECFTQDELGLLNEFHLFYEARLEVFPDTPDVHVLHKSPAWLEIVAKASEVHQKISALAIKAPYT